MNWKISYFIIISQAFNSFYDKQGDFLFTIQTAIIKKQIVKITYKDRKESITEREIEPIGIVFYGNDWHAIAWCWKRKDYRDFIIPNILNAINMFTSFQKAKHLSLDEYIKKLEEMQND